MERVGDGGRRPWGQMVLPSPLLNGRPRVITEGEKGLTFQKAGVEVSQHKGILNQAADTSERLNKKSILFVFTLHRSGVLSLGTEKRK